jgi:glycosyltransferase involved in cell wall biosynthesis
MKLIISEYSSWDTAARIGDHHYARQFLDHGWDVLWISHPVSFGHNLKAANKTRMELAKNGPFQHKNGPIELVPYTRLPWLKFPFLSSFWVLQNSLNFCLPPLKESLRKTGFDKPDLVWITNTSQYSIAEIAEPKTVVARIADDNSEFKVIPKNLKLAEDLLSARADALFATSSPLYDRLKPKYGDKLHLLRNGVDFDHFQGTFKRPEEFKDITGPIVLYVGAIEEWFNPEWVKALAEKRQDLTVVLIGRVNTDMHGIEKLPNVRLLGLKQYERLPEFLAYTDAGIIPFKKTQLVESVSPLKLFEYMAAGLPVVSTSWLELERLQSPALLASSADEFADMVSKVVDEGWKAKRGDEFRNYSKPHSWSARFDIVMEVIGDLITR